MLAGVLGDLELNPVDSTGYMATQLKRWKGRGVGTMRSGDPEANVSKCIQICSYIHAYVYPKYSGKLDSDRDVPAHISFAPDL